MSSRRHRLNGDHPFPSLLPKAKQQEAQIPFEAVLSLGLKNPQPITSGGRSFVNVNQQNLQNNNSEEVVKKRSSSHDSPIAQSANAMHQEQLLAQQQQVMSQNGNTNPNVMLDLAMSSITHEQINIQPGQIPPPLAPQPHQRIPDDFPISETSASSLCSSPSNFSESLKMAVGKNFNLQQNFQNLKIPPPGYSPSSVGNFRYVGVPKKVYVSPLAPKPLSTDQIQNQNNNLVNNDNHNDIAANLNLTDANGNNTQTQVVGKIPQTAPGDLLNVSGATSEVFLTHEEYLKRQQLLKGSQTQKQIQNQTQSQVGGRIPHSQPNLSTNQQPDQSSQQQYTVYNQYLHQYNQLQQSQNPNNQNQNQNFNNMNIQSISQQITKDDIKRFDQHGYQIQQLQSSHSQRRMMQQQMAQYYNNIGGPLTRAAAASLSPGVKDQDSDEQNSNSQSQSVGQQSNSLSQQESHQNMNNMDEGGSPGTLSKNNNSNSQLQDSPSQGGGGHLQIATSEDDSLPFLALDQFVPNLSRLFWHHKDRSTPQGQMTGPHGGISGQSQAQHHNHLNHTSQTNHLNHLNLSYQQGGSVPGLGANSLFIPGGLGNQFTSIQENAIYYSGGASPTGQSQSQTQPKQQFHTAGTNTTSNSGTEDHQSSNHQSSNINLNLVGNGVGHNVNHRNMTSINNLHSLESENQYDTVAQQIGNNRNFYDAIDHDHDIHTMDQINPVDELGVKVDTGPLNSNTVTDRLKMQHLQKSGADDRNTNANQIQGQNQNPIPNLPEPKDVVVNDDDGDHDNSDPPQPPPPNTKDVLKRQEIRAILNKHLLGQQNQLQYKGILNSGKVFSDDLVEDLLELVKKG